MFLPGLARIRASAGKGHSDYCVSNLPALWRSCARTACLDYIPSSWLMHRILYKALIIRLKLNHAPNRDIFPMKTPQIPRADIGWQGATIDTYHT